MKTVNTIIFLILIFFIISLIFNFLKKGDFFKDQNIGQALSCYSDKIDKTIIELPAELKEVEAFISFNSIPLASDLESSLKELNIVLDKKSIIFDYIWSKIPINSLCALIELEEVKSVFTLNNK